MKNANIFIEIGEFYCSNMYEINRQLSVYQKGMLFYGSCNYYRDV